MLKYAAWVHGNALVEELPRGIQKRHWGWGTELQFTPTIGVVPQPVWCHIPIASPVILNDARLRLQTFFLLFKTGQHAAIDNLHVFDGPHKVFGWDAVPGSSGSFRRSGDHSRGIDAQNTFTLPTPHELMFGLSLSFTFAPVALTTTLGQVDPEGTLLITTAGADLF